MQFAAIVVAISMLVGSAAPPASVEICHKPGTPAEQAKTIPQPALRGHLGHGDTLGGCPTEVPDEEPTVEEPTAPEPPPVVDTTEDESSHDSSHQPDCGCGPTVIVVVADADFDLDAFLERYQAEASCGS